MGLKDDGKRDRRHVSGRQRRDVVLKVRALETQRDAGVIPDDQRAWTVGQWLEHWLTAIAPRRVRLSTLRGYEARVRKHLIPKLGHHRLDRLQPEHLEVLYDRLLAEGLKPASVLVYHRIISRALRVAHDRGRVNRNVALHVQPPSVERQEVQPLTAREAQAVLAAAAGTRNGPRWTVALALGLRQGEALGARWCDVDLDAAVWRVRQQLQRVAYRHGCTADACPDGTPPRQCTERIGGMLRTEPKTARGRRDIGIPQLLVPALRAHRQAQLQERLAAGQLWQDNDLVFAQANGKPLDSRDDHAAWKALLARANVRPARLHDARHTAATLLLEQGVSPRVAMEILGHSTIAVTQNTYQHVMPAAVAAAAEAVGAALLTPQATTLAPPVASGGT
jgi:integrase